ncbi:MAG: DUF11 domain-containing protein [Xanthomonadales bacterium]|nr:DUF11 domain-containing protein [Xanthomonadales bacterium]
MVGHWTLSLKHITAGLVLVAGMLASVSASAAPEGVSGDISLTLVGNPMVAPVSSSVTYSATVSYTSGTPADATGVQVTFFSSAGMVFQSFSGAGWNCVPGTVITCQLAVGIPVGGSSALSLQYQMPATPQTVQIQGNASYGGVETNPANNTAAAMTQVVLTGATLGLNFNGSTASATTGDPVSYTAQVSNSGPGSATSVTLNGTLSGPITVSGFSGTGWSCTSTSSSYSCNFANPILAGNASPILTINAVAGPGAGTATISATADSPDATSPVTQNRNLAVAGIPQLRLIKSDSVDPVPLGQRFFYNLTVFNDGSAAASGISLSDTLPSQVSLVLASGAGWNCSGSSTVLCSFSGSLAPGNSTSVRIDVDAQEAGVITNTATASLAGGAGDSDSEATTIIDRPALSFTKSADRNQAILGENIDFTLSVRNNGSSAVSGLRIVDRLPPNLSFVAASGSGWSCSSSAGNVVCTSGGLQAGASSSVLLTTLAAGPAGTATNTATLTFGSDGSGLSASASVLLSEPSSAPDLVLSKTDSADPVTVGAVFSYSLNVTNRGGPASNLMLSDTLPNGLSLVSASGAGWNCNGAQTVVCSFPGTLDNGAASEVTIAVTAPGDPAELFNTATVSVANEANPQDNSDTEATTIVSSGGGGGVVRADLALTASVDPAAGNVGDLVSFVLNASNLGPDSATNVRVGGSTASGLQLISAMAAGFDCSVDGSSFSCVGATLASGANASVVVGAQIDGAPGSSALLSANVSSTVADPISDNNLAQASVSILAPTGADLSLTKSDSVDPVDAGQQFSYTLTVSNLGPASATGVRIVDPLPAGLTLVSASAPGMSCSGDLSVTCLASGSLPVGQSLVATLVVTAPDSDGSIENIAEVFSTSTDPNSNNNRGSQTTTVNRRDEQQLGEELNTAVVNDPVAAAAAGPVGQICANPSADFARGCDILTRALDEGRTDDVAEALRAISPNEIIAQSGAMLELANTQFFNVDARLAELRGGGGGFSLSGLTVVSGGKAIPFSLFRGLLDSDEPEVGGSGDLISPWGFFVNGTISQGDQNLSSSDRNALLDFDSYGITAGVDYRINYRGVVGAALGYTKFDSNLTERGELSTSGFTITGYGSYYLTDNFYMDARLSYNWGTLDQDRRIRFGSGPDLVDLRARGSTDSTQFAFAAGAGYHYNAGGWVITPNGFIRYVRSNIDGFGESGAGAFSAIYEDQDLTSFQAGFGLQVTKAFSVSSGVISPQFDIQFVHESKADDLLVQAQLAGADPSVVFQLDGDEPDSSFGNIGLGFVYVTANGRQAYVQYRESIGKDGLDRGTLNLGARFEF